MKFAIRTIVLFTGSLLCVAVLVFFIIGLTPGNIAEIHNLAPATAERLHLDKPLPLRFVLWLSDFLHADFGLSLVDGTPVSQLLARYAPPTVLLTFGSLFLSFLIALPMGVMLGLHPNSRWGKLAGLVVYTVSSVPVFVLGYMVLAVVFGVFEFYVTTPPEGPFRFWPWVGYYILPIAVLAIGNGTMGQFVRFIAMEVQGLNGAYFIQAARARGASLFRHFFKSMVLPMFSIVVANLAVLLGGVVVVERIFNFHGLGWLSWEATLKRDFYVVMGITIFMALAVRSFMLANDFLAYWLDPRRRS